MNPEKINSTETVSESIKTAAIMADGKIYTGITHGQALRELAKVYPNWVNTEILEREGFVTSAGRFVSREEASFIAEKAGQLDSIEDEETKKEARRILDSHDIKGLRKLDDDFSN